MQTPAVSILSFRANRSRADIGYGLVQRVVYQSRGDALARYPVQHLAGRMGHAVLHEGVADRACLPDG